MAERTRSQVVAFRVTKAERRQIDTKVRSSGLSQQTYLLQAALGEPICVVEAGEAYLTRVLSTMFILATRLRTRHQPSNGPCAPV